MSLRLRQTLYRHGEGLVTIGIDRFGMWEGIKQISRDWDELPLPKH